MKLKSLLIVGAGEFGQLVRELAFDCGYQKVEFLDDDASCAVGKVADYKNFVKEYAEFSVAIGNPAARKKIITMLECDFKLATLIHPKSHVSVSSKVCEGCIVEPMSVVNTGVVLGKACFINAGAVVNHNSIVGEYSQIDCNAVVAAKANVPEGMKVFSGSVWNNKL